MTEKNQDEPKAKRIPEVDAVTLTRLAMLLPPAEAQNRNDRERLQTVYRKIILAQEIVEKVGQLNEPQDVETFVKHGCDIDIVLKYQGLKTRSIDEAAKELFRDKPAKRFEELIRRTYPKGWTYQTGGGLPTIHTPLDKLIEGYKERGLSQSQFDYMKNKRDEETRKRGRDNRLKGLRKKKPRKK